MFNGISFRLCRDLHKITACLEIRIYSSMHDGETSYQLCHIYKWYVQTSRVNLALSFFNIKSQIFLQ